MYILQDKDKKMRASVPGVLVPEERREVWEKENRDPATMQYSPRRRASKINAALQRVAEAKKIKMQWGDRSNKILAWVDNVLNM